ncbi:MAG TPA: hypothetical protein PKZ42_06885 [Syntrophales bacterium]|nr:hypothetical protein [Geobacteraceae bacterium]HPQ43938.1 hypothetical protein [Syntrophales bacterium]
MAGKIFYRERQKINEGEKKPRFNLVAVAGLDMKIFVKHMRKSELEQIAREVGAELIELKRGEKQDEEIEV